jgi:hypothetical protein
MTGALLRGGDIQNEIGPVKMPDFDIRRYDSLNITVRTSGCIPSRCSSRTFA